MVYHNRYCCEYLVMDDGVELNVLDEEAAKLKYDAPLNLPN